MPRAPAARVSGSANLPLGSPNAPPSRADPLSACHALQHACPALRQLGCPAPPTCLSAPPTRFPAPPTRFPAPPTRLSATGTGFSATGMGFSRVLSFVEVAADP